jgi:hypothetical protein
VSPANTPAWLSYSDQGYAQIKNLSANTIVLTPGWTYTALNLPALESKVGKDPQWPELLQSVSLAKQHQLNVAIYPIADTVQPAGLFWKSATKDGGWWQTWFDRYTPFLLNYADLAAVTQADMLILGEPSSKPSLAHGVLPNGGSSNSPIDSDARWNNILTQIRQHYRGKIVWAVTYPDDLKNLPTWVKDLDGIYILWNVNLSQKGNISPADFEKEITTRLTNDILPLQKELGKPVYVRFAIASANGGMANCLGLDGNCASMDPSGLHNPVSDQAHLNLQEQVDGYNAVFNSINQLNWVNGVSVAGYYLPANLQDGSPSVRGKPAASVIWYWFQKMTGSAK